MPFPELVMMLDDSETLRALKISREELELLVRTERLPTISIAGRRRFVFADVQALMTARQTEEHRN